MYKPLSQLLFMIILFVAFVGQTMAYASMVSYGSISELPTSTQLQSSSYEHSSTKSSSQDDCCDVECCENECICPANTCASMVYLHSNLPLSDLAVISESLNLLATEATFFTATSLYRPPIFTS